MAETRNSQIAAAMLVMVICFSEIHAWAGYGGGSGTSTDPFLIETAEQLNTIGTDPNNWGKHFKLVADIDLSTYPTDWFHPIGSSGGFVNLQPFQGVFDGDGHAIIGLSYSTQEVYSTGLFAYVRGDGASVKNLRLIAPRIDAPKATRVGALIGISSYGVTVVNCSALNVTIIGNDYVGGLIGQCSGPIQSCSCTGVVASNGLAGGLTAATDGGKVVECHFDGTITGKNAVGGLIGWNRVDLTSCSTAGSVTGYSQVGGLVGYAHPGKIAACCSTAAPARRPAGWWARTPPAQSNHAGHPVMWGAVHT